MCDGIALEGLRLIARSLPAAVAFAKRLEAGDRTVLTDAAHVTARGEMLCAAMMGAVAFQKDLGVVHSCAHALSTVLDMHHGLANGIMIDHVMRFNLPAAHAKLAELAHVAQAPGGDTGSTEARALAFIAWLAKLKEGIDIPARLSDYCTTRPLKKSDIPRLVEIAVADICHNTNPRPCTAQDLEHLFHAAF
jgi:alcohol dehydrogenase class IV